MSNPNQSNEGHVPVGFPRPIRDADNALVECAKLLRMLTETLAKVFSGGVAFRASLKFWPPGVEGHIEVRK